MAEATREFNELIHRQIDVLTRKHRNAGTVALTIINKKSNGLQLTDWNDLVDTINRRRGVID